MDELKNIIDTLKKSDAIYSISYWTTGNEEMLKEYAETEHYWGCAYHHGNISITRWAIDNSDLEEWLTVGLTDEEVHRIAKEVK